MSYTALAKLKKNSVSTTLSSDITAIATTIPVTELSVFYDKDSALILKGIVIGYDSTDPTKSEEITITGASGASGAGNLTGATREVNKDGTIGAGYAWPSGTNIAVVFSTGIYERIKDNIAAIYAALQYGYKELTVMQAISPNTGYATIGQDELGNGVNYTWASFNHTATQKIQYLVPMPADWDGTLTSAIISWTSTSTGSGTVKWMLKGYRVGDDDTLNATLEALGNVTDTFITASDLHVTAETTLSVPSGTGNLLLLELYRDYANDTLADPARFMSLRIKYGRTI